MNWAECSTIIIGKPRESPLFQGQPSFLALQAGEDGREFVAALERQTNLFDGCDLQIGLGLVVMAHTGQRPRMLQVQTP